MKKNQLSAAYGPINNKEISKTLEEVLYNTNIDGKKFTSNNFVCCYDLGLYLIKLDNKYKIYDYKESFVFEFDKSHDAIKKFLEMI